MLCAFAAARSGATGYYGPSNFLDDGGARVGETPEFFWSTELERMAAEFHPPEKFQPPRAVEPTDEHPAAFGPNPAAEADERDFDASLKSGAFKPADPVGARASQVVARKFVDQLAGTDSIGDALEKQAATVLAAEAPSEFADYHRGAYFYHAKKWAEARAAWEALLARPAAERHYRTVWAAFMLGKLALKTSDPAAPAAFQKTRALAAEGFADSLGLAADSYGWEARSEWKQGHPEKAAPLYLMQLALGDRSAIVSLKALIPDREPVYGLLNYGLDPEELKKQTAAEKAAAREKANRELQAAARDPLLRRLVTVHILAAPPRPYEHEADRDRCTHWLTALEKLPQKSFAETEYLGWVAYQAGHYPAAVRWLALADPTRPASAWLKAKLAWREGRTAEAAESMQAAWRGLQAPVPREGELADFYETSSDEREYSFFMQAGGELAALRLSRSEFAQALEIFLSAGLWSDAAYLAERVLTLAELRKYVAEHAGAPPTEPIAVDQQRDYSTVDPASSEALRKSRLRYLFGRRLVREGQLAEAVPFLPGPYGKLLEHYRQFLQEGGDAHKTKEQRAAAWSAAAWLARYDGMELMGTEVTPDGFLVDGEYEVPDLAEQRRLGQVTRDEEVVKKTTTGTEITTVSKVHPIALPASPEERKRLAEKRVVPDVRFHYRLIAVRHALEAAKFLPDQSAELGDLLNTAGTWCKDRDEKLADRIYAQIEKRAARSPIGREVLKQHWFVQSTGPWVEARQAQFKKLEAEAGVPAPEPPP